MVEGGTIVIIIAVCVAGFFLLRGVMCWYYKINKITSLLERILDRLPEKKTEQDGHTAYQYQPGTPEGEGSFVEKYPKTKKDPNEPVY